MKKILLLFAIIFSIHSINAKPIDKSLAETAAKSFIGSKNDILSSTHLKLVYTAFYEQDDKKDAVLSVPPCFYVYSFGERGFIIVSGDDASYPILGFSTENSFDTEISSKEVEYWLGTYKSQINYIREAGIKPSYATEKQWNYLLSGNDIITINSATNSVQPLTHTKWNQAPFYNGFCPFDDTKQKRTVAGCVATAMAQVMKYWSYPITGKGSHSYAHYMLGTISASFDDYEIPWDDFANTIFSTNDDLAYTTFLIGVSVEMRYGVDASGAFVISSTAPQKHCSEFALKTYWKYDPNTLRGIEREKVTDDEEWESTIKNELISGRPVIYTGFGREGGHAWVCDGFRSDNYYSMNWGWGGRYNGYYRLNALDPGIGGIGSGSGLFNYKQEVLVGIQPDKANSSVISLSGDLAFDEIPVGSTATAYLNINNLGSTPFEVSSIETTSKFSINGSANFTVAPGETETVEVVFEPNNVGTFSGIAKVHSNATFGVSQITLTGKASSGTTSVTDADASNLLFPNPANDILNIDLSDRVSSISIKDIAGKTLFNTSLNGDTKLLSIPLIGFSSGTYFVEITAESGKTTSRKFTISR